MYIVTHSYSQEHLVQEDLNVETSTDICYPNTVNNYINYDYYIVRVSYHFILSIILVSMFLKTSFVFKANLYF